MDDMLHTDTEIDYTDYLNGREEADAGKRLEMQRTVEAALEADGVFNDAANREFSIRCYADGVAAVELDGDYYGLYDTARGRWYSGYVGGE